MLNDAFAHGYSPRMQALTGTVRHIRPPHVTSPKAANTLGTHGVTARETVLVQPRPAITAASHCLDCERPLLQIQRATDPVKFAWLCGYVSLGSIINRVHVMI
jgi:hypothetical protein